MFDGCGDLAQIAALPACEQVLVIKGIDRIRRRSPGRLRGIEEDNVGAFIENSLQWYRKDEGVQFTLMPPQSKNHQA